MLLFNVHETLIDCTDEDESNKKILFLAIKAIVQDIQINAKINYY